MPKRAARGARRWWRIFRQHLDVLSAESRERLEKNPLRILDSKAEGDKALVADAPRIDAFMTSEAGAFFESVQTRAGGIERRLHPRRKPGARL